MASQGTFRPHRSVDMDARVRHIETYMCRIGAVPVSPAVEAQAAKNIGNAIQANPVGGGGGGGGGGSAIAALYGDVTGPLTSTTVNQASGPFEVIGGDLTVDSGKAIITYTDAATNTPTTVVRIIHHSSGTTAAGFGSELDFVNQNQSGVDVVCGYALGLYTGGVTGAENGSIVLGGIYGGVRFEGIRIRGGVGMPVVGGVGGESFVRNDLRHAGTNLGFYGTVPIPKPTVTGSRAANAALASLLTALASQGLVTDSSVP